jgi:putative salt-induced outer membrane protein
MKKLAIASLLAVLPLGAWTAAAEEAPKPLATEAELGVLLTSGNTDSTAMKAKLDAKHDMVRWRNHFVLEGLYKEDEVDSERDGVELEESQTTAEKYFASAQADYKLDSEHSALFVFGSYDEDRFSGYDFQAAVAAGYSDRLFQGDSSFLDYSVGPGMSFNRTDEVFDDEGLMVTDNLSEESAMVRIAANYQYDFSENGKFTQTFASDMALESGANTRTKAETAVTANLNQSLAIKASFVVTHNTEVPADRTGTDSLTALTLVYSF